MKRLSILLLALCSSLIAAPASSQEYQGCFMINDAGRVIRLNDMCPQPQSSAAQAPQEDLRAIAYADAYCQARKDGYPGDVARRRGVTALQNISIQQLGSVEAHLARSVDSAVLRDALAQAAQLCPEFQ